MKKYTNATLIFSIILTAMTLSGCIQEKPYEKVSPGEKIAGGIFDISDEELGKMQIATDPVIAHIPLKARLNFHLPDKTALNGTVINMTYILTPSTDLRVDVSDGIVLPEGIVFVENNLPTNYITLSKNKTCQFNATIKVVKSGSWKIYASPGVGANVTVLNDRAWVVMQEVFDATAPIICFSRRESVSDEQYGGLMTAATDWLRGYGAQEHEKAEFNCSMISGNAIDPYGCEMPCCGCEMICYSNSTLVDRYYFVIEDNQHTDLTKIRNVYRWAYLTPSGYQPDPVCEEIKIENIGQGGMMVKGNVVTGNDGEIIGKIYETDDGGTLFVPASETY